MVFGQAGGEQVDQEAGSRMRRTESLVLGARIAVDLVALRLALLHKGLIKITRRKSSCKVELVTQP
ncbi:hypothetical protein ACL02O_33650 [Micromonospora sp. MS34]|uniref:hypothetical protein n=1 Tax=Micromonospora sp. MS34 TaxID=3385971 RepID=UPI0039A0AB52